MDIITLLGSCIDLERGAGDIYRTLAERTRNDTALVALWTAMAKDEDDHARKLDAWRTLAMAGPPDHREIADGFERGVDAVEATLRDALARARQAETADEALAIALALERSELDGIYTMLLDASPIVRFPDVAVTYQRETTGHHAALIAAVRARRTTEANVLAASLLAAADHDRAAM